ncbi:MAG: Gfo/Idh/MocA family oxidoreductase [Acidobacteriota bacterium]
MREPSINQKPPMPESPAPIVIIGAGGIVKDAHLPAYRKAGFKVQGIYDKDPAKAEALASAFEVGRVCKSLNEAVDLGRGKAVFDVAVPAAAILDVLPGLPDEAGVLIQKPMGENLAQGREIRDLCHKKRLKAAINFQLRYAPLALAARSLIDQGAIGKICEMDFRVTVYTPWQLWTFLEGIPRVEILYHSIHYLDLIRSFLGNPKGVYAKSLKHPKAPRLAATRSNIILDYGESVMAGIAANHHHEFGPRQQESYVKWEGEHGAIKAQLGVNLNYPEGLPDNFEYCILSEGEPAEWRSVELKGTWFPDAFIGTMASVMRFVEGSAGEMPTSVDDAFETMAVVEAAYQSSATGATKIPYA